MTAVTNTPKNKPALIEFRRGCYPPAMAFSGVARNASKCFKRNLGRRFYPPAFMPQRILCTKFHK